MFYANSTYLLLRQIFFYTFHVYWVDRCVLFGRSNDFCLFVFSNLFIYTHFAVRSLKWNFVSCVYVFKRCILPIFEILQSWAIDHISRTPEWMDHVLPITNSLWQSNIFSFGFIVAIICLDNKCGPQTYKACSIFVKIIQQDDRSSLVIFHNYRKAQMWLRQ